MPHTNRDEKNAVRAATTNNDLQEMTRLVGLADEALHRMTWSTEETDYGHPAFHGRDQEGWWSVVVPYHLANAVGVAGSISCFRKGESPIIMRLPEAMAEMALTLAAKQLVAAANAVGDVVKKKV